MVPLRTAEQPWDDHVDGERGAHERDGNRAAERSERDVHRTPQAFVRAGYRGELLSHDLIELVQLVAMTMPTGALHLWAPEGQGTLWLCEGMIVHARGHGEQGTAAFQKMLRWTGGDFSVDSDATPPARTITLTTTQLLLESTRILDEEAVAPRVDAPEVERSGTLPILRSAAEHFERGLEAVHERRYDAALAEWERAVELDPDHRVYQHNLRRLRALSARTRERDAAGGRT